MADLLISRFTHTIEMSWLLPKVPRAGVVRAGARNSGTTSTSALQ
jgi:hypothetical protein